MAIAIKRRRTPPPIRSEAMLMPKTANNGWPRTTPVISTTATVAAVTREV
jgi:hypothetical protein